MEEIDALREAILFARDPAVEADILTVARPVPGRRDEWNLDDTSAELSTLLQRIEGFASVLLRSASADHRDTARYALAFVPQRRFRDIESWVRDHEPGVWALAQYVAAMALHVVSGETPRRSFRDAAIQVARNAREEAPRLCNHLGLSSQMADRVAQVLQDTQHLRSAATMPQGGSPTAATITTLIVHGTWAASYDWWKEVPGTPNFWDYIKGKTTGLVGGGNEFTWSGSNNHAARVQGGKDLLTWWAAHKQGDLQIIAHSHGANVVYLACAADPTFRVKNMIALGGPSRIEYPPRMDSIERLHNVYSEHDSVQTAGAIGGRRGEGRMLGDGSALVNWHRPTYTTGGASANVGHSDLHEEAVWSSENIDRLLI